jgi:hypothetical protein
MDDNQTLVPASFIDLYVEPGRIKPSQPREWIAERFEWCDDMAAMLCEPASQALVKLGVAESDVLHKLFQGLVGGEAGLSEAEALWVTCRLAELLAWPLSAPWVAGLSEPTQAWWQRQMPSAA